MNTDPSYRSGMARVHKPLPKQPNSEPVAKPADRSARFEAAVRSTSKPNRLFRTGGRVIDLGSGLMVAASAWLTAKLFSHIDSNSDFAPYAEAFAGGAILPAVATVGGVAVAEALGASKKTSHFLGGALGIGATVLTTAVEFSGDNMPLVGGFIPGGDTNALGISAAAGGFATYGALVATSESWKNEPVKPIS